MSDISEIEAYVTAYLTEEENERRVCERDGKYAPHRPHRDRILEIQEILAWARARFREYEDLVARDRHQANRHGYKLVGTNRLECEDTGYVAIL